MEIPQFNFPGMAQDLDLRARRHTPYWQQPGLSECFRLLLRNTWLGQRVLEFIHEELARNPGKAQTLEDPMAWDQTA